ncbi:hypothetical protein ACRRTK_018378 [Alexandromys fortis]
MALRSVVTQANRRQNYDICNWLAFPDLRNLGALSQPLISDIPRQTPVLWGPGLEHWQQVTLSWKGWVYSSEGWTAKIKMVSELYSIQHRRETHSWFPPGWVAGACTSCDHISVHPTLP